MRQILHCPRCRHEIDPGSELNDAGREMLTTRGPPLCPHCSRAKMVYAYEATVTQLERPTAALKS